MNNIIKELTCYCYRNDISKTRRKRTFSLPKDKVTRKKFLPQRIHKFWPNVFHELKNKLSKQITLMNKHHKTGEKKSGARGSERWKRQNVNIDRVQEGSSNNSP